MRSSFLVTSAMALAMSTSLFADNSVSPAKDSTPMQLLGLNNPVRRERLRAHGALKAGRYSRRSYSPIGTKNREKAKYLRKSEKELAKFKA